VTDSEPQHVREDSAEPEGTDARDDGYRWIPAQQLGHAAGVSRRVGIVQFGRPQRGRYHAGRRWDDAPRCGQLLLMATHRAYLLDKFGSGNDTPENRQDAIAALAALWRRLLAK
jgi:hypothetical protein